MASEIQTIPPGPWAVEGGVKSVNCDGGAVDLYCADIHVKGDYRHIAYIQSSDHALALGRPGISKEAAEATARLIAAAPDLYSAVERMVESIERWVETGKAAGPDESQSIYEQLRAALNKAEGR